MERFNRAERRAQTARLKAKRKKYWGIEHLTPKQLGAVVQHPQMCSCPGCGNQRKYVGRTLQELRDIETLKEQLHAIGTTTGS